MTQVVLENLNPVVIEKLQVLAQKHNRSLSEEIEAILEQAAITSEVDKKAATKDAWLRIDQARMRHAGQTFSDSVELLREDRNR
jgi:plasmid stability protein